MLKRSRENKLVNCLLCWRCDGRTEPNHFTLKEGGAWCGICETKNPLGNLRKLPIVLVTALIVINVAFTRGGTLAHGLHPDSTRPIGPWVKFELAEGRDLLLPFVGRATGAGGLRTFGAVHEVHNIRVEETAHQLLHCALL